MQISKLNFHTDHLHQKKLVNKAAIKQLGIILQINT